MTSSASGALGPGYELWATSRNYLNTKCVHLSGYSRNLQELRLSIPVESDAGSYFDAELVPERDNPSFPTAISVRHNGRTLGYLPSRTAADVFADVSRVAASKLTPLVPARLWANESVDRFALTVATPKAGHGTPMNNPPEESHVLLPSGAPFQVSGEEDHADYLREYLPVTGSSRVLLTVEDMDETGESPRYAVVLDGLQVGSLSRSSSGKIAPLIGHYQDQGLTPVLRAKVDPGDVPQVSVQVIRSHEAKPEDLELEPEAGHSLEPYSAAGYALPLAYDEDIVDWSVLLHADGTMVDNRVGESDVAALVHPALPARRPSTPYEGGESDIDGDELLRQARELRYPAPVSFSQSDAPAVSVPSGQRVSVGVLALHAIAGVAGAFVIGFAAFAMLLQLLGEDNPLLYVAFLAWTISLVAVPVRAVKRSKRKALGR